MENGTSTGALIYAHAHAGFVFAQETNNGLLTKLRQSVETNKRQRLPCEEARCDGAVRAVHGGVPRGRRTNNRRALVDDCATPYPRPYFSSDVRVQSPPRTAPPFALPSCPPDLAPHSQSQPPIPPSLPGHHSRASLVAATLRNLRHAGSCRKKQPPPSPQFIPDFILAPTIASTCPIRVMSAK